MAKQKDKIDTKRTGENLSLEKQLWKAADKLRKNIDAAEYKHIVLGLIFLKYISDAFEELYEKLKSGKGEYAGADPEDKDEYKAENIFFVPETARWSYLSLLSGNVCWDTAFLHYLSSGVTVGFVLTKKDAV